MSHSIKVAGLTIMRGNNKLGKVLNISLPPCKTCSPDLPCYKDGCYGIRFYKLRKGCRNAWEGNWEVANNDRANYMLAIQEVLTKFKPAMFRWHVAGDMPDTAYLREIAYVAAWTGDTKHLVFTKKYGMLNRAMTRGAIDLPDNLSIVVSAWPGLEMPEELRARFAVAWMKDPKNPDPRIPKKAMHCDGGCETCGLCWKIKPGKSVYFDKH